MNAMVERIKKHPCFQNMRPEDAAIIAEHATEKDFEAGEMIFREDEPANKCYLIEQGRVAIEAHEPADGTRLVQILEPGEPLGWSWLFPPFEWHFRARAIEPVCMIVLDGAHMLVVAEENRDFGFEVMKRIAKVLIRRLRATRKRLLEIQKLADAEPATHHPQHHASHVPG